MRPQDLHGTLDGLVGALAAAGVGGFLEALDGDGRDQVADTEHLVGEGVVDQGAVGEEQEAALRMLVGQRDQVVLADGRLAAGIDVEIGAQGLALVDDAVKIIEGQVQAIAVLGRPAAGAVQVACRGRVHQDGPGDVAAILLAGIAEHRVGDDVAIDHEAFHQVAHDLRIDVIEAAHGELVPVVGRVGDDLLDQLELAGEAVVLVELQHHVAHLLHVVRRILGQIVIGLHDGGTFHPIGNIHSGYLFHLSPPF